MSDKLYTLQQLTSLHTQLVENELKLHAAHRTDYSSSAAREALEKKMVEVINTPAPEATGSPEIQIARPIPF